MAHLRDEREGARLLVAPSPGVLRRDQRPEAERVDDEGDTARAH